MCDSFAITPAPQKLKHYATNQLNKVLDKVAFVLLEATVDIKLDEVITDNLVMAFLGTADSFGGISIGTAPTIDARFNSAAPMRSAPTSRSRCRTYSSRATKSSS